MSTRGSGEFEASAVLESLPVSSWHRRLVVLVGLGSFFDLYEVFLGGVLAPMLAKEFGLASVGKAAVVASGFAGMFVGANVLSILADRLGRRRVFILNLLAYSLFSVAGAFSPNVEVFLVLRFLAGIGLGAELVLVDTYLAEFLPGKVRGRYLAWAYTVGFLGVPLAALLGGRLVAAREILGVVGWRWLLIIGGLGAVFVLVARRSYPSRRAGSNPEGTARRPLTWSAQWRPRCTAGPSSSRGSVPRRRLPRPAPGATCWAPRSATTENGR